MEKFGYGKIVGVPKKTNNVNYHTIKCDITIYNKGIIGYIMIIPLTKPMKRFWKDKFVWTDVEGYRFCTRKSSKKKTPPPVTAPAPAPAPAPALAPAPLPIPDLNNGTILIISI